MLFKSALFLAFIVLVNARPNPSSVKTIASSSGSKSSIKSPSQKLAEKNSSPSVASIVELPLQSINQAESTNLNVGLSSNQPQAQDSDIALQYSSNQNLSPVKPTESAEIGNGDRIPGLQPYSGGNVVLPESSDLVKNVESVNIEPVVAIVLPAVSNELPQPVVAKEQVIQEAPLKPIVENVAALPVSPVAISTPSEVADSPKDVVAAVSNPISPLENTVVSPSSPSVVLTPVAVLPTSEVLNSPIVPPIVTSHSSDQISNSPISPTVEASPTILPESKSSELIAEKNVPQLSPVEPVVVLTPKKVENHEIVSDTTIVSHKSELPLV